MEGNSWARAGAGPLPVAPGGAGAGLIARPTPGPPTWTPRQELIRATLLLDAGGRQADPPTPEVLRAVLVPAWEVALALIPTAQLGAALQRAVQTHHSAYALTTGDVLVQWERDQEAAAQTARLGSGSQIGTCAACGGARWVRCEGALADGEHNYRRAVVGCPACNPGADYGG